MDNNSGTCIKSGLNYEAEYYRQEEMLKKLICENQRLKDTIIGMCEALYGKAVCRNER